jgi:3-hydroxybutyryl-CoA dehydrogenase
VDRSDSDVVHTNEFEVDYPHADSAFPNTLRTAEELITKTNMSEYEAWQMLRANAIECAMAFNASVSHVRTDALHMITSARALVVGGGTMGAGIAQSLLGVGAEVVLVESTAEAATAARSRVAAALARAAQAGRAEPGRAGSLEHLVVQTDFTVAGAIQLVVEAVPEDLQLKRKVLADVQAACPDALIATNTSSLSIDELAAELADPSALIGLHFFNPVPASTVVEIVIGTRTRPEVVELARTWIARMGKESIEVMDSPGFATSRLGLALGLEAIRMAEAGVASPRDIDRGMTLGYKHPIGPLELTDRIGLDVRLAIARHLETQLGPRFAPPQLLIDLVAAGHLGRKTSRGFFHWDPDGRRLDAASISKELGRA